MVRNLTMSDEVQPLPDNRRQPTMDAIFAFLAEAMEFPTTTTCSAERRALLHAILFDLGSHDLAALLHAPLAEDSALDVLQVEYTRLFLNAVPHVVAPPYGSFYLDGSGLLYGPSAAKVKEFYREQGYEVAGPGDMPDHLALELRFLARLHAEGREEEAADFLARWFRPWFGRFRRCIAHEARHPYYLVLVELIDFFTREEE